MLHGLTTLHWTDTVQAIPAIFAREIVFRLGPHSRLRKCAICQCCGGPRGSPSKTEKSRFPIWWRSELTSPSGCDHSPDVIAKSLALSSAASERRRLPTDLALPKAAYRNCVGNTSGNGGLSRENGVSSPAPRRGWQQERSVLTDCLMCSLPNSVPWAISTAPIHPRRNQLRRPLRHFGHRNSQNRVPCRRIICWLFRRSRTFKGCGVSGVSDVQRVSGRSRKARNHG